MTSPVFTAHGVPDLIGALPTRFGFVPEESLCVIATSGPRHRFGFSMRLDLPRDPGDVDVVVRTVTHHLRNQGAEGAIIIAVSATPELAEPVVRATEQALGDVRPVVSAWADGTRYWTTFDDCDPLGHPYVSSDHDLAVVHAVAEGQEILGSRAELVARFAPVTGERARWLDACIDDVVLDIASTLQRRADGDSAAAGRTELLPLLERCLGGSRISDGDTLRMCVWVSSVLVRDVVWQRIRRENARPMLRVWAHVARHAPPPFEPGPLCLAAFAAYLVGDGAQALIALERALEVDPDYSMASLLLQALQGGLPPQAFDDFGERERRTA